jgi:hypothetical protein
MTIRPADYNFPPVLPLRPPARAVAQVLQKIFDDGLHD